MYVLKINERHAHATEASRIVRKELADQVKVKIVISAEDKGDQYIDVINEDVGKRGGLRHIYQELVDDFAPEICVMAGDSDYR